MEKPMYYRLAQNLMIAYHAYRFGNRISTEENKREEYEPDEFWLRLAQAVDNTYANRLSDLMRETWKNDPLLGGGTGGGKPQ